MGITIVSSPTYPYVYRYIYIYTYIYIDRYDLKICIKQGDSRISKRVLEDKKQTLRRTSGVIECVKPFPYSTMKSLGSR
jgi:hypothetical protein